VFKMSLFDEGSSWRFLADYKCYPVTKMLRPDMESGGKIFLPPSALATLSQFQTKFPMYFKLSNTSASLETHCGVLEFVSDKERVYIPRWMMSILGLVEGQVVRVEKVSLPVAKFAKFQPQSTDFLDITNVRAVLEKFLRGFACLTTGDMLAINYNDKIYELKVLETKPENAVTIIECDMNVDFAPPVGYQEPSKPTPTDNDEEPMAVDATDYVDASKFRPFCGQGNRLDGKAARQADWMESIRPDIKRGIPNYEYKKRKITFIRATRPRSDVVV